MLGARHRRDEARGGRRRHARAACAPSSSSRRRPSEGPERGLERLFELGRSAVAESGVAWAAIGAVGIGCGRPARRGPRGPDRAAAPAGLGGRAVDAARGGGPRGPAALENDATAAAAGEHRFGAGRGTRQHGLPDDLDRRRRRRRRRRPALPRRGRQRRRARPRHRRLATGGRAAAAGGAAASRPTSPGRRSPSARARPGLDGAVGGRRRRGGEDRRPGRERDLGRDRRRAGLRAHLDREPLRAGAGRARRRRRQRHRRAAARARARHVCAPIRCRRLRRSCRSWSLRSASGSASSERQRSRSSGSARASCGRVADSSGDALPSTSLSRRAQRSCCRASTQSRPRLIAALGAGGRVYTFGNGGSSADAQHFAEELVGRFKRERRPLPARRSAVDSGGADVHRQRLLVRGGVRAPGAGVRRRGDVVDRLLDERTLAERRARPRRRARGRRDDRPVRRRRRRAGARARRPRARRPVATRRRGSRRCTSSCSTACSTRSTPGRPASERASCHMIGNAHIDPVWLWQWPEGYQEVRATFQSAVDRLDEYPDFVFTCDSSCSSHGSRRATPSSSQRIQRARRRGPLPDRRRLVDRAGLQHPGGRVVRAPGALRPALPARHVRDHRDRRARTSTRSATTRRSRRSSRKSGCDSYVFLRPGPAREGAARARSSGGSRRTARACSPTGSRTSTARRRTTSASTSRRRSRRCRTRTRTTPSSTASATTAAARRRRTSIRSRLARWTAAAQPSSLRRSSTRRRRTGSRPVVRGELQHHCARLLHGALRDQALEPAARRTCCSGRRSGARSPTRSAAGRTRSTS